MTKPIHTCLNCSKPYKSLTTLNKHMLKCVPKGIKEKEKKAAMNGNKIIKNNIDINNSDDDDDDDDAWEKNLNNNEMNMENNYDVSMTFLEGKRIKVEVKKQPTDDQEDGDQILKEILKPKISETYQDEIDKLGGLINMVNEFVIPNDDSDKDRMIDQLKNTMTVMMIQAKNLIKEMKKMSYRNNYLKNNVMLAAFVLDRCRKDVPESDDDFDNMFSSQIG
jgi:hypothetical protein